MAESSIRVICGPTAAGKSSLALSLAIEYSAVIISADSRQIYRSFDIGTAKPEPLERRLVQHQGIDIVDPRERYSAAAWAAAAPVWIESARAHGKAPLVVGGTGLYIRALFEPFFTAPPFEPARRARLQRLLAHMSTPTLRTWCERLDPARARLGRTQLLRSVEIALLSGQRLSALQASSPKPPAYRARYLVVDPVASLRSRIEARVDAMLRAGWLLEVESLAAALPDDAPAWKATGYRALRDVARGISDLSSARDRIIIETRQYAKRQRTWFRHQVGAARATFVNPDDPDCRATVERWWKESS